MLEKFDNYQLLSKIATGGMAEIFLAKHVNSPVNSMPIAIKRTLKQYSNNPILVKMFLSEARIICNISHENIVKIYDFGKYDDQYFIAMEYVFGQNLGSILKKIREKGIVMPLNLTLEIVLGVLCGLEHAHNAKDKNGMFLNIVHLDMNPNNILISYDGKIKVVDFGIANVNYSKKLRETVGIQGTFAYLSPEQCLGTAVDRRSDIFSLGIILYEMLSGKTLYKHLESDAVILNAILNEPIVPIQKLVPNIDPRLASIVMKALEKDPNKRYASAMDMREDLLVIYNFLEFDPASESLQSFVKKFFPSHYIKMTKVIERAQTEYLVDELFEDIGELGDFNKAEREQERNETKIRQKNAKKIRSVSKAVLISGIVGGLVAIAIFVKIYFFHPVERAVEMISVFSQPEGAEIFINGENTGKETPTTLQLESGKSYIIEFKKGDMIGGIEFVPTKEKRHVNMILEKK